MSPDISELLKTALEHHQSGRLQEADTAYRAIIQDHPEHPDAWHLMGVLAHQVGNNELAVNLIENAIKINPNEPDFHNNCGEAYRGLQKPEQAIACYEKAIALKPAFAGAHNNLGNTLKDLGRFESAINHYRQAISASPDFFMAYNNLGITLKDLNRVEEAIAQYEKALTVMPEYPEALSNLGNVLQDVGRYAEAISHYRKAIQIMPQYAQAHSNLANALRVMGRYDEAIAHYQEAIANKPDFAMAHCNLGIALDELGRPEEAINAYEKAIAIDPDYAEAHYNLGFALQELGQGPEAISEYQKAIAIRPGYAAAHMHISMIKPDREQVPVIEKLLTSSCLSEIDTSHCHFALGNIHNSIEDYDRAFEHYLQGNSCKRATLDYDHGDYSRHVDKLIETFTAEYFQMVGDLASSSDLPVFIVGLPRSGTTLIEQILSSHPQVYGAGELEVMGQIETGIAKDFSVPGPYPECMIKLGPVTAKKYADVYLDRLRSYSQQAKRITDKDPGNFHRIGIIRTLFPGARIIHCQRIAADTCISIFFNYFAEGNEYSFDLEELGKYYLDYERVMNHWNAVLPGEILNVSYEDLVHDQESVSRRLIDFIDLDWDEHCLDFYLNQRPVRTASSVQVRQPLYTQSINRWKHYEKQLAPLLNILGKR